MQRCQIRALMLGLAHAFFAVNSSTQTWAAFCCGAEAACLGGRASAALPLAEPSSCLMLLAGGALTWEAG